MIKYTRRFKKNKKNKTFKKGGSSNTNIEERQGVVDMIGNKLGDVTEKVVSNISDIGLKIAGLERINKDNVNNINSDIVKTTSNITNNITNVADKTSAALIENVNEVLGSSTIHEGVQQVAQDTADITKELLSTFNETLDNPEVKQEVKNAIDNASEIASVAVDALEEPLNKAVDITAEATQKATSAAISGAIKVGTDAMGAVPFWGAIIDLGKMVNDGSKATSAIVEAGTEVVEAATDTFIDSKKNFEKGMKELEEKKKITEQISKRTSNSINEFQNPSLIKGGIKTKRRLLKRKLKSKRVRFAI